MRNLLLSVILSCFVGYARSNTITAATGSVTDVNTAITSATAGDTVVIPAGTFTWATGVSVNKAITLQGSGTLGTIINLSSSGPSFGTGALQVTAAAVIQNIDFVDATTSSATAISASTTTGWRITSVRYRKNATSGNPGYFIYANSYGLVDHCDFASQYGQSEMILIRGQNDQFDISSWTTNSSMGTVNAVFIEDCAISGSGYVCDAHGGARAVIRFCTISGGNKIDGHGAWSNSPYRGVRHVEAYNNTFTADGFITLIELRGGTGRCFDNQDTGGNSAWLALAEYYVISGGLTSANYPFTDGVGVGKDPKAAASEPYYLWNNTNTGGKWLDVRTPSGVDMTGSINPDRDYFETPSGTFNGSSGVGRGTTAAMNAITPTKTGVGFWVTDQASWRSGNTNTSGQLYVWSGSAWVLNYTPYTYPHPLQGSSGGGGPSTTSIHGRRRGHAH